MRDTGIAWINGKIFVYFRRIGGILRNSGKFFFYVGGLCDVGLFFRDETKNFPLFQEHPLVFGNVEAIFALKIG
jgi:hypothetical protein